MFEAAARRKRVEALGSGPMRTRGSAVRSTLSLLIAVGLAAPALPASDRGGGAVLTGRVVRAGNARPLPGARVWLAESPGTRVIASAPSSEGGAFSLRDVPPGTYALAVEVEPGLYPLESALNLSADSTRVVRIELPPAAQAGSGPAEPQAPAARNRIWNNPFTASLLVLGAAVLVSVVVQSVTDEATASPD